MMPLQVGSFGGFQNNLKPISVLGGFQEAITPSLQLMAQQRQQTDMQNAQIAEAQRAQREQILEQQRAQASAQSQQTSEREASQEFQKEILNFKAQQENAQRIAEYQQTLKKIGPAGNALVNNLNEGYQSIGELATNIAKFQGIDKQDVLKNLMNDDEFNKYTKELEKLGLKTMSNEQSNNFKELINEIKKGNFDIGKGLAVLGGFIGNFLGTQDKAIDLDTQQELVAQSENFARKILNGMEGRALDMGYRTFSAEERTALGIIDPKNKRIMQQVIDEGWGK